MKVPLIQIFKRNSICRFCHAAPCDNAEPDEAMLQARKRQLLYEGGDDADIVYSDCDITGDEAPEKYDDSWCPVNTKGLARRLRKKTAPKDIPIHSDGSAEEVKPPSAPPVPQPAATGKIVAKNPKNGRGGRGKK